MTVAAEAAAARKSRLLDVAVELLKRDGYEGLTMRALSAEGGASLATLYKLFGSKEELAAAAVASRFREILAAPPEKASRAQGIERVFLLLERVSRSIVKHPDYARTLRELFRATNMPPSLGEGTNRAFERTMRSALDEMVELGEFARPVDCALLARRVTANANVNFTDWARGVLGDDQILSANIYAASLLLAGLVRPEIAETLRRRIDACTAQLAATKPRD